MINETDIRDMQEDLEGYTNFVESMIMTKGKDRLVENGEFNSYTLRGIGGLSTSAFVNRTAPLKYLNYTS